MPTPQDIATAFLEYLKEQGLYEQLPAVCQSLQQEIDRNHDITIVSALPLRDEEVRILEQKLTEKWGEHRIIISHDPSLLSGMLIRFRDQVVDLSGRQKLTELQEQLAA